MAGLRKTRWLIPCLIAAGVIGASLLYLSKRTEHIPPPLSAVKTLAGAGTLKDDARFEDPFGLAVAADGSLYVSDGGTGRIFQLTPEGVIRLVVENLDVPSAIALAPDGTLVVAETGSHTIIRVDPLSGQSSTIAGVRGRSGFADGDGRAALFNAPVGVAVGHEGTIYVADTYNDRIRAIDAGGQVRTIAGGAEQGMADAEAGADARFDTPCGVAVGPGGALIVADTGNNRIRRVEPSGAVRTIAGTGERKLFDGPLFAASFDEPVGVTVEEDGTIYVAEAGGSAVRACRFGIVPDVQTVAGGRGPGLVDGSLVEARLRSPSGVAVAGNGVVFVADTGNRLVRAVVGETRGSGTTLSREAALALYPTAAEVRAEGGGGGPRWPYDPPERPREIAATFGEIRGELSTESKEAYFHNGLDIPGAYGETARAVRTERVLLPLAVEDVGTWRERIRLPRLGYIHLRVGRDSSDRPFDDPRFRLRLDGGGRAVGVRVRRGERFQAGDPLGTLNNQYHVHLIAGPSGGELNALAALELPGVRDTVAPTIEKDGVRLFDAEWRELRSAVGDERGKAGGERIEVAGDVRIVVRAYDQMDGNAARRRLGLYRLGYQILNGDGSPAPPFDQPQTSISFETLPFNRINAAVAYAEGSRSGATGDTIFAYIVTNRVRDHEAAEDYWHASALPPGDYIVRVFAEDFFGNRTTHDTPVRKKG